MCVCIQSCFCVYVCGVGGCWMTQDLSLSRFISLLETRLEIYCKSVVSEWLLCLFSRGTFLINLFPWAVQTLWCQSSVGLSTLTNECMYWSVKASAYPSLRMYFFNNLPMLLWWLWPLVPPTQCLTDCRLRKTHTRRHQRISYDRSVSLKAAVAERPRRTEPGGKTVKTLKSEFCYFVRLSNESVRLFC